MDWSADGSRIVVSSFDGRGRVYSRDGVCLAELIGHQGPICSVKWNQRGNKILTGGIDGWAGVWCPTENPRVKTESKDVKDSGEPDNMETDDIPAGKTDTVNILNPKHQFRFHQGAILDVDWKNNFQFASCGIDSMIYVCELAKEKPIRTMSGHTGHVNCLKWDPSRSLLASCSDDKTAKIWTLNRDTCMHTLEGHELDVHTLRLFYSHH